jgi:nitrite reductase (NADH) small subunit
VSTATYNLGPVALIPLGEGRLFDAGGVTIAVFRTRAGRVYATEPWCPHRGGPLADGIVASDRVLCPLHGYAFELATGRAIHHECGSIKTYPVRMNQDDEVLVTMRRPRRAVAAAAAAAVAGVADADAAEADADAAAETDAEAGAEAGAEDGVAVDAAPDATGRARAGAGAAAARAKEASSAAAGERDERPEEDADAEMEVADA